MVNMKYTIIYKPNKICNVRVLLLVELIAGNKKEEDTTVDEATPTDVKRYPARRSSEKAKKRLKSVNMYPTTSLIIGSFRFDFDDEKVDAMINGELDWQTLFADENEPEVVK